MEAEMGVFSHWMGERNLCKQKAKFVKTTHSSIERLEHRTLLAAVHWTGAGGDNLWTTPDNWSGNAVPGPLDDVAILVTTNPSVEIDFGDQAINSLVSDGAITLTGGTLEVTTTVKVNN